MRKEGLEVEDSAPGTRSISSEALSALLKLGINKNVAEKSIEQTIRKHGIDISLEDLIKYVLMQA